MTDAPSPTPDLDGLLKLAEAATKGPWELQDGCSWRRIGTHYTSPARAQDGNVLCPTNSRTDNHPDLTSGRGEDTYANLRYIVAACNAAPALIARIRELEARPAPDREAVDFESGQTRTDVVNIVERYVTGWGGEYADNPYDAAPHLAREILALIAPTQEAQG